MIKYFLLFIMLISITYGQGTQRGIITDKGITEKYWKLIQLNGKPITVSAKGKEPHIILKKEGNKVNGSGGCNSFMGSYALKEGGRIQFSQMASTLMACIHDDGTEAAFLKALSKADSYFIKGDTLQLNRAKMSPLAVFKAVYLK
ncbi:MAG: META domain-containing protein [Sediminibacterium sp.]|jgi:heat shock protein HslJ|nr:META domain-containing protein [Chitinophagaceae bacterium]MCA6447857.1 META domain-containing protein [Chitinophagaceae bacterium]